MLSYKIHVIPLSKIVPWFPAVDKRIVKLLSTVTSHGVLHNISQALLSALSTCKLSINTFCPSNSELVFMCFKSQVSCTCSVFDTKRPGKPCSPFIFVKFLQFFKTSWSRKDPEPFCYPTYLNDTDFQGSRITVGVLYLSLIALCFINLFASPSRRQKLLDRRDIIILSGFVSPITSTSSDKKFAVTKFLWMNKWMQSHINMSEC